MTITYRTIADLDCTKPHKMIAIINNMDLHPQQNKAYRKTKIKIREIILESSTLSKANSIWLSHYVTNNFCRSLSFTNVNFTEAHNDFNGVRENFEIISKMILLSVHLQKLSFDNTSFLNHDIFIMFLAAINKSKINLLEIKNAGLSNFHLRTLILNFAEAGYWPKKIIIDIKNLDAEAFYKLIKEAGTISPTIFEINGISMGEVLEKESKLDLEKNVIDETPLPSSTTPSTLCCIL